MKNLLSISISRYTICSILFPCVFLLLCTYSAIAQIDSFTLTTNVPDNGSCGTSSQSYSDLVTDTSGGGLISYLPAWAPSGSPTPVFPPGAIKYCADGKIALYFEDLALGLGAGFDDHTLIGTIELGEIRRNTFCSVIDYIKGQFSFDNIDPSQPIRIFVKQSLDPIHNPATPEPDGTLVTWTGRSFSTFYDSTTCDGIRKGWMCDYLTSPSWYHHDSLGGSNYHAAMQLNFDATLVRTGPGSIVRIPIGWHNDITPLPPGYCAGFDLYSVLLHEMGHNMGWFSLVKFRTDIRGVYEGLVPYPVVSTTGRHVFSALDWSLRVGANSYPLILTKLLSGTGDHPILDNSDPTFLNNNNYWVNGLAVPENHPVYSGGYSEGKISQYLSHLDDQQLCYTLRERVSPGDQQDYVMGTYELPGVTKRTYSKGDIQNMVSILGYNYTGGDAFVLGNHIPYDTKMARYSITGSNYGFFTENVGADFTMTNDVGSTNYIDIDITTLSGLVDGDVTDPPSSISVVPSSLVGFRGCDIGGNNHNALSWVTPYQVIRYSPPPNFYGKAQFGFNFTDGHEVGGYEVITLEVLRGTNVTCAPGGNMVCNPDFEAGSEIRLGTGTFVDEMIPNSVLSRARLHESKWQGIQFSDGHPYCFGANIAGSSVPTWLTSNLGVVSGSVVSGSVACPFLVPAMNGLWGADFLNCPIIGYYPGPNVENPLPLGWGAGEIKYQCFAGAGASYYNLRTNAQRCKHYILDFDIFIPFFVTGSPLPIKIGLADHTVDFSVVDPIPSLNFLYNYNYFPTALSTWQHVTVPFWYCPDDASNILFIDNPSGKVFHVDNMSLREDLSPPPLTATIVMTSISACTRRLTAVVTDAACDVTYSWTDASSMVLGTAVSVDVSPTSTSTYYLTVNDGCRLATTAIVVPVDPIDPITGFFEICVGSSVPYVDATPAGYWSSSNTSIATIDPTTGVATGIAGGVVTISYSNCAGSATMTVTVLPTTPPIVGPDYVCLGSTVTLTDPSSGGVWTSDDPSIASVGAGTGVVYGASVGTTTISYLLTGCDAAKTITVIDGVSALSGPTDVCVGSTITLTHALTGGTWTSSDVSKATVDGGGVVTGVAFGYATITYTLSPGCYTTLDITIYSPSSLSPSPVTLCYPGATSTIISAGVPSPTWTSSSPAIATVVYASPTSATVTGVSAGTAIVWLSDGYGCISTANVIVSAAPIGPIIGPSHVCIGGTIPLYDFATGGNWTSSDVSIATVDFITGVVTGVNPGIAVIDYTLPGCGSSFLTVTVVPTPIAYAVTGGGSYCAGGTGAHVRLASSQTGVLYYLYLDGSLAGVVMLGTGAALDFGLQTATGVYTVEAFTVIGGCPNMMSGSVTVSTLASPTVYTVTGGGHYCVGGSGLHVGLSNSEVGVNYQLYHSGSPIGTPVAGTGTALDFGLQTLAGTYTSDAVTTSTGCMNPMAGSVTIVIDAIPSAISGPSSVCTGQTITLTDATGGGTWLSSDPTKASVSTTGVVTGISTGTVHISYTVGTCSVTKDVTVYSTPDPISGLTAVCTGSTTPLTDAIPGGTWTSSSTAIATVSSGGIVTGVATGTFQITYSVGGCFALKDMTVYPTPAAISGPASVCIGFTISLTDATGGGTWTTSSSSIATVSTTGVVTGVSAGVVHITYTVGSCYAVKDINVDDAPAAISGPSSVCTGQTITLTDASGGGTWTSGSSSIATVTSAGVVSGVSSGFATISYTVGSCVVTKSITVYPTPAAITGPSSVCLGLGITLTDATGSGTWTSSSPSIATVSSLGVVIGVAAGSVHITYTVGTCFVTKDVTVYPVPTSISGTLSVCVGSTTTLSSSPSGGSWNSSAPGIATVGVSSGVVSGLSSGTAPITYTIGGICSSTAMVTVYPLPIVYTVTGGGSYCAGGSGVVCSLSNSQSGVNYQLYVGGSPIGSPISGTGSPLSLGSLTTAGTYTVKAINGAGCTAWMSGSVAVSIITVDAISVPGVVCVGNTITLTDATPGGTWGVYTGTGVASISAMGIVSGLATGTALISYTASGCIVTTVVSVNPAIPPITGTLYLCEGSTTLLADIAPGGTWSSAPASIATVDATGTVTGGSTGAASEATATITYTESIGCWATTTVTVYSMSSDCSPCHQFGSPAFEKLSPTITSSLPSGHHYYMETDVTVSSISAVTATDAVIFVKPGKTLYIDPSSALELDGSHLFGCGTLWNGIVLQHDAMSSISGTLTVQADAGDQPTLIEDALTGVYIEDPAVPSGNIFTSDNAIFNRNRTGVYIKYNTSGGLYYPYRIRNTIFTARDFGTAISTYPLTWPTTNGTDGPKAAATPATVYDPPFNVDDPHATTGGTSAGNPYNAVNCKDGVPAQIGIKIEGLGGETSTSTVGGIPIPDNYYDITIGDPTPISGNLYQNLFDNLQYGIHATNSSITCLNNAFIHMQSVETAWPMSWTAGTGIYGKVTNNMTYQKRMRVYSINSYQNLFYGFRCGVEAYNYFHMEGSSTYMINSSRGAFGNLAKFGYFVNTSRYDGIKMDYNTISNTDNGIAVWQSHDPMTAWPYAAQISGSLEINNNVLQATPSGYSYGMTQFMRQAVSVQNPLTGFAGGIALSTAHVDYNQIDDVYNGVYINGLMTQKPTTSGNSITMLRMPPIAATIPAKPQYGINHVSCKSSTIFNNTVGTSSTTGFELSDSVRAVYVGSTNKAIVSCNDANGIGRGFEFFWHDYYSFWRKNSMTNNAKGFVLNNSTINEQGGTGDPIDNTWSGTWGSTTTPPYQTFVDHSFPSSNKLHVYYDPSSTYPTANAGQPAYLYYTAPDLPPTTLASGTEPLECPIDVVHIPLSVSIFEESAQQSIPYLYNVLSNRWTGQYSTWETMLIDTFMTDSSSVLQMFDTFASNSRYALLTSIESRLTEEDFSTALTLINSGADTIPHTDTDITTNVRMADVSTATPIVENYVTFYRIYINYLNDTMSSSDSLQLMALAQLCPIPNGAVVYKARALYSLVFNDLSMFSDDSCTAADTTYFAERHSAPNVIRNTPTVRGQQYYLSPNPNNGTFILVQQIEDKSLVRAEIWNSSGLNIYKGYLTFQNKVDTLQIRNILPGLYMLRLVDNYGREFIIKFVVE